MYHNRNRSKYKWKNKTNQWSDNKRNDIAIEIKDMPTKVKNMLMKIHGNQPTAIKINDLRFPTPPSRYSLFETTISNPNEKPVPRTWKSLNFASRRPPAHILYFWPLSRTLIKAYLSAVKIHRIALEKKRITRNDRWSSDKIQASSNIHRWSCNTHKLDIYKHIKQQHTTMNMLEYIWKRNKHPGNCSRNQWHSTRNLWNCNDEQCDSDTHQGNSEKNDADAMQS